MPPFVVLIALFGAVIAVPVSYGMGVYESKRKALECERKFYSGHFSETPQPWTVVFKRGGTPSLPNDELSLQGIDQPDLQYYNELEWHALNLYHEARGEPEAGLIAIAHVVRNRVRHWAWPDTVSGVIRDPWQFSWMHDDISDQPTDVVAWNRVKRIAAKALQMEDITGGATHYYAHHKVFPNWAKSNQMEHRLVIDNHTFMKERKG